MTVDPKLAEIHTCDYTTGLDDSLLLSPVISDTQGPESSLGLNYHARFPLGKRECNWPTQNICVLCISVYYVYYMYLNIM